MATKILLADDSQTIQKIIQLSLVNDGYEIKCTANGNDTKKIAESFVPDIALIDISLPEIDGYKLSSYFNSNEKFTNTKIILLLNAFEKVNNEELKKIKFAGKLVKPFDPGQLRNILNKIIAGELVNTNNQDASAKDDEEFLPEDNDFNPEEILEVPVVKPAIKKAVKKEMSQIKQSTPFTPPATPETTSFVDLKDIKENTLTKFEVDYQAPIQEFTKSVNIKRTRLEETPDDIKTLTESTLNGGFNSTEEPTFSLFIEDKDALLTTNNNTNNEKPVDIPIQNHELSKIIIPEEKTISLPKEDTSFLHIEKSFSEMQEDYQDLENIRTEAEDDWLMQPPKLTPPIKEKAPNENEPKLKVHYVREEPKINTHIFKEETHSLSEKNIANQVKLSDEQLEKIVRESLKDAIEKIAWKVVPDIAENIIKKELEKLLGESGRTY